MREIPKFMNAIVPCGWGLHPHLSVQQKPTPQPGPNDVLVEVHAASVNPKDWKLNSSLAVLATPLLAAKIPPLFGDDLAGVVVECGHRVTNFAVGDAVFGMDMHPRTATLAQFAIIAQHRIARKPPELSFSEAAAMPLAALTALQGLRDQGQVQEGARVLIIGASGGVGTFAVQIARALACDVTAVCSGRNAQRVKALGAQNIVDYTQQDFHCLSERFDLVFDVTSFETPARCQALIAPQGRFVSTGGHAPAILGVLRARKHRASFVWVNSQTQDLETLASMVSSGQIKPIIDSRFPLHQADDAYAHSRSGRARGKIVIDIK